MRDKPHGDYARKLINHYTAPRQKSGMAWHNWVIHQVQLGGIPITVAYDLLCELYRHDPNLDLYCGVASYYFYRRINRPAMIERLMQRLGDLISPYVDISTPQLLGGTDLGCVGV